MPDLAVDVPGEDPQPDADLRCSQSGTGRLEHGVGEVVHQGAQLLVEGGDLDRAAAQDGVAEQTDGLDGHAAPRVDARHSLVGREGQIIRG